MSGAAGAGSKLSLRKRLKDIVKRPSSGTGNAAAPAPNTAPSHTTSTTPGHKATATATATAIAATNTAVGSSLLERTLLLLSEQHRLLLQPHLPTTGSNDVDDVIQQVLSAARAKRQLCVENRWKVTLHGQEFLLHEQADKVMGWLRRFQSVGDIVANADPVHVGLPWAAVRFLLEVAITSEKEMQTLLAGCEVALYMSNRLKAYINFIRHVPDGLEKQNFEAALIKLYACLLTFLAQAIGIYEQSTTKRIAGSLWKGAEIASFEQQCLQIASDLEVEASNCDRVLQLQNRDVLSGLYDSLLHTLGGLKQYHVVQATLDRIEVKLDMGKLPFVTGAVYNSYDQVHTACHPATRLDLLRQIEAWATNPKSKSMFWLNGKAGTGKSTIAFTVAQWLEDQEPHGIATLAATFFFKRGEGDRGSAQRLFPTLAHQLADKIPELKPILANALDRDHIIASRALAEQFDKLIRRPLEAIHPRADRRICVFVVDALDECDKDVDIDIILQLWPLLSHVSAVQIKLLLTSRPDIPIREGFRNIAENMHLDLALQDDIPQEIIRRDLETFIRDKLSSIQQKNDQRYPHRTLGHEWPGTEAIYKLASKAMPLFIVAATMTRFIEASVSSALSRPDKRLAALLDTTTTGLSQMAEVYFPILRSISKHVEDPNDKEELYQNFRTIVGSIIILAEPLSIIGLASLLHMHVADVEPHLHPLHSVLHVPRDTCTPVRPFHLSFSEFLIGSEVQGQPFAVDRFTTHQMLLESCLRLMSGPQGLRENICGLSHPGYLRKDVHFDTLTKYLPEALQYACRYWVYHAQYANIIMSIDGEVHRFLQRHFLHWLEGLTLMGRIGDAIDDISALRATLSPDGAGAVVSSFLEDARRFVLMFNNIVDQAPLQLYSSALLFTPYDSIIRRSYSNTCAWIKYGPVVPLSWSLELQKLDGQLYQQAAMSFSPDGSSLALRMHVGKIELVEVRTGRRIQSFRSYTSRFGKMCFSPNGLTLATTSSDNAVILWDVLTGQELRRLREFININSEINFSASGSEIILPLGTDALLLWDLHDGRRIKPLKRPGPDIIEGVFSPDGSLFALPLDEVSIGVVDVEAGQELRILETGGRDFNIAATIVFSPDNSLLALTGNYNTIWIWDVQTGQPLQEFNIVQHKVSAVRFSPDCSLLALAFNDCAVRLWKVHNGEEVLKLEGHTATVHTVNFSPDGSLLASSANDGTVRLWQARTGQRVQEIDDRGRSISRLKFSPEGSLLASLSKSSTIRLWEVRTGQELRERKLQGHQKMVNSVSFSRDGSLLASASEDSTVKLWETRTGREVRDFIGHTSAVDTTSFSPDGLLLASASSGCSLRLWEVATGREVKKVKHEWNPIKGVYFSPNGSLLAALYDWEVVVWSLATYKVEHVILVIDLPTTMEFLTNEVLMIDQGAVRLINLSDTNTGTTAYLLKTMDETNDSTDDEVVISAPTNDITIKSRDEWIHYRGQRLLWLPHEYRSLRPEVYQNTVALGRPSGIVTFITFEPSVLESIYSKENQTGAEDEEPPENQDDTSTRMMSSMELCDEGYIRDELKRKERCWQWT